MNTIVNALFDFRYNVLCYFDDKPKRFVLFMFAMLMLDISMVLGVLYCIFH